jgi:hypothetical protein
MRTECQSSPFVFSSLGNNAIKGCIKTTLSSSSLSMRLWHSFRNRDTSGTAVSAFLGWANSNEENLTSRRAPRL